ncbi:hypothetical protein SDC9_133767 [bioreactor metagenome]|uniref:Uncharacterized protein n=1 Tax=bioreactor metagenome TaxID=1076179 RepID=A0A645DB63_9ZZZZ
MRNPDIFVRRAIINHQAVADNRIAAGENHAFEIVAALKLIPGPGLENRFPGAADDPIRIVRIEQQRAEAVIAVLADAVINRQPAPIGPQRRRIAPDLLRLPIFPRHGQHPRMVQPQRVVGVRQPDARDLTVKQRTVQVPITAVDFFRKQNHVVILLFGVGDEAAAPPLPEIAGEGNRRHHAVVAERRGQFRLQCEAEGALRPHPVLTVGRGAAGVGQEKPVAEFDQPRVFNATAVVIARQWRENRFRRNPLEMESVHAFGQAQPDDVFRIAARRTVEQTHLAGGRIAPGGRIGGDK